MAVVQPYTTTVCGQLNMPKVKGQGNKVNLLLPTSLWLQVLNLLRQVSYATVSIISLP